MYHPWVKLEDVRKYQERYLRGLYRDGYSDRIRKEYLGLVPSFFDRADYDSHGHIGDTFAPLLREIYQRGYELGYNRSHLDEKMLLRAGIKEAKKQRINVRELTKRQIATLGLERRGVFEKHPAEEGRRQFMLDHMHSYSQHPRKPYENRLKSILLNREAGPKAVLRHAHAFLQGVLIEGFMAGVKMRRKR